MSSEHQVYVERKIPRNHYQIYAHDYPGKDPAFVLMHGFPDNLHIYDYLAPLLARSGNRVVAFDFLGYGGSDKPTDYDYTAENMEGDLDAIVNELKLDPVIPVGHDISGPTAINWGLDHQERVARTILLNSVYDSAPTLKTPEFIVLFGDLALSKLADAFQNSPAQFQWLLQFTGNQFMQNAPPELRERGKILEQIVGGQFASQPSVFPAFRGWARDVHSSIPRNDKRVTELVSFDKPVSIIWGAGDPYLDRGVAEHMHGLFPRSTLRLLPYGHWLQIDGPEKVAAAMLG